MKTFAPQILRLVHFAGIIATFGFVAAASAQTIRERLKSEPDFRIYSVIFGVTAPTNSAAPAVRLAEVIDPKSGTTDAVKIDIPDAYIKAASKKIEAKKYEPEFRDGKPVEFFTYFFYVPGYSNIVVVDLDKPISQALKETGEPGGAANGSQPIRSETNRTSSAAGPRR